MTRAAREGAATTAASTGTPVRRVLVAGVALCAAVAAGVTVLWLGGGLAVRSVPGLPAADAVTVWLAAAGRLLLDLAATVTVGCLLGAAFLVPGDGRQLGPAGYRLVQAAGWAALVWAVAAVAAMVFTLALLLGAPVARAVSLRGLYSFATTVSRAGRWP
jgi:hypothetical protein